MRKSSIESNQRTKNVESNDLENNLLTLPSILLPYVRWLHPVENTCGGYFISQVWG